MFSTAQSLLLFYTFSCSPHHQEIIISAAEMIPTISYTHCNNMNGTSVTSFNNFFFSSIERKRYTNDEIMSVVEDCSLIQRHSDLSISASPL